MYASARATVSLIICTSAPAWWESSPTHKSRRAASVLDDAQATVKIIRASGENAAAIAPVLRARVLHAASCWGLGIVAHPACRIIARAAQAAITIRRTPMEKNADFGEITG